MVATDLLGRGIDIERVNIVFNYDMPTATATEEATNSLTASNTYLHRVPSTQVGRAGRFGTKGLAISMVSSPEDSQSLNEIQERFEIAINELPTSIDVGSYSTFLYSDRLNLGCRGSRSCSLLWPRAKGFCASFGLKQSAFPLVMLFCELTGKGFEHLQSLFPASGSVACVGLED